MRVFHMLLAYSSRKANFLCSAQMTDNPGVTPRNGVRCGLATTRPELHLSLTVRCSQPSAIFPRPSLSVNTRREPHQSFPWNFPFGTLGGTLPVLMV